MSNILVCDDERSICEMLEIALRKEGHKVETVTSGEAAKRKLDSALFDVVVTDIRMPQTNGIEVLRHAHQISPDTAVVLITAVDDIEAAVAAVKAGGAADYIRKSPSLIDDIRVAIGNAVERGSLKRQNLAYKRDAAGRNSLDNIVGTSPAMGKLKNTIRMVASTGSTVLIHGESGTGKELVARAVHTCSPRAGEPFTSINCGAFPETLLESELFGYVKGAFTGAVQNKRGLFEVSTGGTIFLDEISEMTLTMQVKLLRVLQERCIRPVGGTSEIPVDVRVIAATNKNLDAQVADGVFREDLYYRLSVIPVQVPPLRERVDDIELLANHFLKKYAPAAGKSIRAIRVESLGDLREYDWPGNVRQLENTIERAVALEMSDVLHVEIPTERQKNKPAAAAAVAGFSGNGQVAINADGIDMEAYVANIERSLLQQALKQANGVQTKAADLLKLSYRSFRHLMKKYEL
ncbi:two component, sigma54 specific, transcriptional regulator, Fis family [Candidatus Koribacter versatilis Ellin345]|uniref:Two component, sigma54 specific, transcriptional regulator, Fis family n=1 Tax=Koribacter versatilis (strain Ellin345) TaxID=204669 RepID=Q1IRW0_KORVE|nr:sigma-54 dependent transcriptional regulator [Candidatus Koribacter versatilis]ABF40390.1 two component, sigma54 specific, transcriptional regulator, Fis family [Candidatus Koribacter versatilis Ellin345]